MDITNNGDGRFDMDDVTLGHEQLFGLLADFLDDRLCQKLPLEERFYTCVQVEYHCSCEGSKKRERERGEEVEKRGMCELGVRELMPE